MRASPRGRARKPALGQPIEPASRGRAHSGLTVAQSAANARSRAVSTSSSSHARRARGVPGASKRARRAQAPRGGARMRAMLRKHRLALAGAQSGRGIERTGARRVGRSASSAPAIEPSASDPVARLPSAGESRAKWTRARRCRSPLRTRTLSGNSSLSTAASARGCARCGGWRFTRSPPGAAPERGSIVVVTKPPLRLFGSIGSPRPRRSARRSSGRPLGPCSASGDRGWQGSRAAHPAALPQRHRAQAGRDVEPADRSPVTAGDLALTRK